MKSKTFRIVPVVVCLMAVFVFVVALANADDSFGTSNPAELALVENAGLLTGTYENIYPAKSAIIMQGNTSSALDCAVFKTSLANVNRGYVLFASRGWDIITGQPTYRRVTLQEFKEMKDYTIAYYSGYGSVTGTTPYTYRPSINVGQGTGEDMSCMQFNVAQALQVESTRWESQCVLDEDDPLRILIMASGYQLDSRVVKYYARIMAASSVRAIAGYHDVAPVTIDDEIASTFIAIANIGDSVRSSWSRANTIVPGSYGNPEYNWAVLVYKDGGNEYYRFPDFHGNTYADPVPGTPIYRYASFLDYPGIVEYSSTGSSNIESNIASLPLMIYGNDTADRSAADFNYQVPVYNQEIGLDQEAVVKNYLASEYKIKDFSDKICVRTHVEEEQVDTEEGLLSETKKVVERTFSYYDTYNGIKIKGSFISASVDSEGVKNVYDARKGVSDFVAADDKAVVNKMISKETAIKAAKANYIMESDIVAVALAYVPAGNGTYQLCYEIQFTGDFCYVNVQTGEIM